MGNVGTVFGSPASDHEASGVAVRLCHWIFEPILLHEVSVCSSLYTYM